MQAVATNIQDKYGKEVILAETSYCYTSEDGDGFGNSLVGIDDLVEGYAATVQSQATMIRDICAAANEVGVLGVFYWEVGAMPLWIAPEQVRLIPIADRHLDYTYEVLHQLQAAGLRCEVDSRAEKVGYKIRQAVVEKVPYMITIGDNEVEQKTVAVRSRKNGDLGSMTMPELLAKLKEEVETKAK